MGYFSPEGEQSMLAQREDPNNDPFSTNNEALRNSIFEFVARVGGTQVIYFSSMMSPRHSDGSETTRKRQANTTRRPAR
jgi:hypothetical protein